MLRHALRRLLWILPTLVAITIGCFALLSYVPDPADDAGFIAVLPAPQLVELRRARFLDLPRFLNLAPRDLRAKVDLAVSHLSAADAEAGTSADALAELGGATLPYLLPRLDSLDPGARARVALALAPIARRMGILAPEALDADRAGAFWSRFWADRGIDFRPATARRAVRRLAMHGTSMRAADVVELDTFALDELMRAAAQTGESGDVDALGRVLDVAGHVTGHADALAPGASPAAADACLRRWQEWWLVHRADYSVYDGPARLAAMVVDTQYARWAERVVLRKLGDGTDGVPVKDKLEERAPRTLSLVLLAIAIAYGVAVPLGVVLARLRERPARLPIAGLSILASAVPTACVAVFVAGSGATGRTGLAALTLGLALLASPALQTRASLVETLGQDWVRAARARGVPPARIVLGAMRNTLAPVLTLLSLEVPLALAGAFVVEKAFGIRGLGEETLRAVQTRDVAWLMTLAFATTAAGALILLASDIALVALDPRLKLGLVQRERTVE